MKSSAVQHREEKVDVKPAVSPGQRQEMPRHSGPIVTNTRGAGWGSKNDPRKNKMLKIGPLKTRGSLKMGFKFGLGRA